MDLHQTLVAIAAAGATYRGGTQITAPVPQGTFESVLALLDLVAMARRKDATPYEIQQAMAGEILVLVSGE